MKKLTNDLINNNLFENQKKYKATLFDNIQLVYELILAKLELKSFNIDFEITDDFREFKISEILDEENLIKRLAYFKLVNDKYTDYYHITQKNRTKSINQYLKHWFYPYKGKFHPQMIRALINIINLKEGDILLDPFIGSGTTAIEAQLLGIKCIGYDISPLCVIQSRVKTESIFVLDEIMEYNKRLNILIDKSLLNINKTTIDNFIENIENEKVKNFFILTKLISLSDNERRKRDFINSFFKNLMLMIETIKDYKKIVEKLKLNLGETHIKLQDSRKLPLNENTIDGIITSPPYSIALDYIINDIYSLKELLFDDIEKLKENFIGLRGRKKERLIYIMKIYISV